MPWKENYTISDERSMLDSDVQWPDGHSLCMSVVVDLSPPCGPEGIRPSDLTSPEAYYSMNGALEALLGVLQRHRKRATFAVPGVMAEIYQDTVRTCSELGHEIAAHGFSHEDVGAMQCPEEKARIDLTTKIIEQVVGTRPQGWFSLPRQGDRYAGGAISANTVTLLLDAGYSYLGNSLADDIPHWWVADYSSRRAILAMPYYYHFDDQFFLLFPKAGTGLENPDALSRNWHAEFKAQYQRGRHFSMTLHPHAIGFPNRLQMLDDFLSSTASFPNIWNPTHAECAHYWKAAFPGQTHLNLQPSIWVDYPDSLN